MMGMLSGTVKAIRLNKIQDAPQELTETTEESQNKA